MQSKSVRKERFQAYPVGTGLYDTTTMLTAEDLGEIFNYYEKKHGIRLIRNGDYHQHVLHNNIEKYVSQIESLYDERVPYYKLLSMCDIYGTSYSNSIFSISLHEKKLCEELNKKLKPFMKDNSLRTDLDENQITQVEAICRNLSPDIKKQLDEKRDSILKHLENKKVNCCLTKSQAIEEILDIQRSLGGDEAVGYVFTNDRRSKEGAHFEAVIITKESIIKPVEWNQPMSTALYYFDRGLSGMKFYSPRGDFLADGPEQPTQQVDHTHCGVLCVSYLKKLLQDKGKALFEESLMIPLYDEENNINYVYIPPPYIMQYSQTSKFIEFYQMLMGKEISASEDQPKPHNLKQLLEESKRRALGKNDKATAEINQKILDNFDEFRLRWLKGCEEACAKRDEMFNNNDRSSYNLYLAYAAKRMQDEARSPKPSVQLNTKMESIDAQLKVSEQEDMLSHERRVLENELEQLPSIQNLTTEDTSVPHNENEELNTLKKDLQEYVFKRMTEAGSKDFAAHHRTKMIGLKLGYSAEQKITAANKLIYALDMRDKLEQRPDEMKLNETDIGALTTSRLYKNVIKSHLELFNNVLANLPEISEMNVKGASGKEI
ncbi:TPA: hypothetical protein QHF22_001838 [Legionella pneumophila]|uniref:Uncharacterized protein n=3 Tax=Legionella pneumophila TaxID=446 RepID=A0A3A6VVI5_LEGPN|nr:hypothetical protein [Legionella pneumophila]ERB41636.1 hypothetical protein N748_08300 [Legionella pneumophila str. 121004]ERI48606.1 hypothetical protein N749_00870 [Legionella pneumophila str. Leg01/20]ANN94453.1 hypothetical protein A9P84_01495 [Legionella pneumophila]AOU50980.1 hypothetical protein A9E86_01170 [Legionella pneumophila]MCW8463022.1 hypothetical protein [Legionella pneumophila]